MGSCVRSTLTDTVEDRQSSNPVCRAATFVQTVSFMHKLHMEMRQPTVSACPLLWIRWEKLKDIKLKILAYFS